MATAVEDTEDEVTTKEVVETKVLTNLTREDQEDPGVKEVKENDIE